MKRIFQLLLWTALLLSLVGCGAAVQSGEGSMRQPVSFYYRAGSEDYSGGAIQAELRDLGPEALSVEEILTMYLRGPLRENLRSPFPADLALEKTVLQDGLLTLTFNDAYANLSGIQLTLVNACLVHTMTQFSGIDSVCVQTTGSTVTEQVSVSLRPENFLLVDDSDTNDQVTVRLYFSDENGRYLVEETRSRFFASETEIPAYILQQLILGPQGDSALASLPEGTVLLDVQLEDGQCTVNFSEAFLLNRPTNHIQSRVTLFSIVNSLTELTEIESVRILCGGKPITAGYYLDLTEPLYRDESILARRQGDHEFYDANLYVTLEGREALAAVPVRVRRSENRFLAADVLNALLSFKGVNGYADPTPDGALVVDLTVQGGLCKVVFNSSFALCDQDPIQAQRAVRAVVATLCALDSVEQVQIEIYNSKLTSVDLSEPLTVQPEWTLE